MGQKDILLHVSRILDKHKISYILTGSLAVSYYGYPRATHDIDFVIEIPEKSSRKILQAIRELGKGYVFDKEQIEEGIFQFSQLNVYHVETGIKIDFWIKKEEGFELLKFQRKRQIVIDKQKIYIVSPEDLLLTKLLWCKKVRSERHLEDCLGILRVQGNKLDKKYLNSWAKKLKLESLFEEISR